MSFFAGGGALKFIKDYAAAKLGIPLWGPGFLTDGVERPPRARPATASRRCCTTSALDNAENQAFVKSFERRLQNPAGRLRRPGLGRGAVAATSASKAVSGDVAKRKELNAAMAAASFASPRGPFKLSAAHNPVQNFYLRELKGGKNDYLGLAASGGGRRSHRLQAGLIASVASHRRGGPAAACLFRAIRNCRSSVPMSLILIQLAQRPADGLLIFLAASGLTLVFGILGVINLSHGSFYMIGAYLALSLTGVFGDVFLALAAGIPLAFALGLLIEWLFIRHLYDRDHLQQVLLTFALILVFNEFQQVVWGSYPHSIPAPSYLSSSVRLTEGLSYPVYRLA